jgi:hypothetical protein
MEKLELDNESNDPNTYVSCYPNSRRYSMANVNRPVLNQGHEANNDDDDDDEEKKKKNQDTKIDIPSSQLPQYSPAYDKNIDKKVKVSEKN